METGQPQLLSLAAVSERLRATQQTMELVSMRREKERRIENERAMCALRYIDSGISKEVSRREDRLRALEADLQMRLRALEVSYVERLSTMRKELLDRVTALASRIETLERNVSAATVKIPEVQGVLVAVARLDKKVDTLEKATGGDVAQRLTEVSKAASDEELMWRQAGQTLATRVAALSALLCMLEDNYKQAITPIRETISSAVRAEIDECMKVQDGFAETLGILKRTLIGC